VKPPHPVVLPFLGSRGYLHGTTLYAYLVAGIPDDAHLCFRIHRRIQSNCIRVWRQSEAQACPEPCATLDWEYGGDKDSLWVESCAPLPPVERRAYEEHLAVKGARVTGEQAVWDGPSPFNWLATAIPLFKAILSGHPRAEATGQWWFTRFDGHGGRPGFSKLEIRLLIQRAGVIAKSKVRLDGRDFGDLYFSWTAG
jgi:hypothetical protein